MHPSGPALLLLINDICDEVDGDLSLASLASRAGWSESYLQRAFTSFAGESPKRYGQRLRLTQAAVELLTTDAAVLDIALAAGLASHEVFTRAFRRQFGCSPRELRASAYLPSDQRARHREVVHGSSPCLGLYRVSMKKKRGKRRMPTSAIERRVIESEQPILFIRRRITVDQLQQTMGQCFGVLYTHGQKAGLAIAGHPMSRYIATGTGLWTVDCVMPLLAPADANGEMEAGVLASGPVAFAVHEGPYDSLSETYAAIEKWIERNGYRVGGAPWESYVTDPGQTPNPDDWRTEVFWPLES